LILPQSFSNIEVVMTWVRSSFYLLLISFVLSCSSKPPGPVPDPAWTAWPVRSVENGYIIYVGTAEDLQSELSHFKAQGQALEDLANECSLIPLGTRVEDRFTKAAYTNTSYVRVALEFQDCEKAKAAKDAQSIRQVADLAFTEELKKYQYFMENGEFAPQVEVANNNQQESNPYLYSQNWQEPISVSNLPVGTEYYALRQNIAYQKEVVILSPPQTYAPNSPEAGALISNLNTNTQQLTQIQLQNPNIVRSNQTWSNLPQRPIIIKPPILHPSLGSTTIPSFHNRVAPNYPRIRKLPVTISGDSARSSGGTRSNSRPVRSRPVRSRTAAHPTAHPTLHPAPRSATPTHEHPGSEKSQHSRE
jgi:hypothetical protein